MKLVASYCIALALMASAGNAQSVPCSRTYTLDADFDEGWASNVYHTLLNKNQLQLLPGNDTIRPFPYIWIACSKRGTVVRIDVNSGDIMGEYRTAPSGIADNPSRTTVDHDGNVWVTNRDGAGSVCKIGLVIGGTRVDKNGTNDSSGQYLKPPFIYCTAVDRDGDGLIRTSKGLGDILPWDNTTDGAGGTIAYVEDAVDECILVYQRFTNAAGTRLCAIDHDNSVWVSGHPIRDLYHLNNEDGRILSKLDVSQCNSSAGYGGIIDKSGILWSTQQLLKFNPVTNHCTFIPADAYGLALDPITGDIWYTSFTSPGSVTKLYQSGLRYANFPKPSGGDMPSGIVITNTRDVWIANRFSNTVTRLDSNGILKSTIQVGAFPTGVAVDVRGKIWVTNVNSNDAMRIDPDKGFDHTGAVDLRVDLGNGAGPYNYSDMTGAVALSSRTWTIGTWTIVHKSCLPDSSSYLPEWGIVAWNADVPVGTSLIVEARRVGTRNWIDLSNMNGVRFCNTGESIEGRYLEVRVTFKGDMLNLNTPVLYDLTIGECGDNYNPSCELLLPDKVVPIFFDTSYVRQEIDAVFRLKNNKYLPVRVGEVTLELPTNSGLSIASGATLILPGGMLLPGEARDFRFPLLFQPIDVSTTISLSAFVKDTIGNEMLRCHSFIHISEPAKCSCTLDIPDSIGTNTEGTDYLPESFPVKCTVFNEGVEPYAFDRVTLMFSGGMGVSIHPDSSNTGDIGLLGPGESKTVVWTVILERRSRERRIRVEAVLYEPDGYVVSHCDAKMALAAVRGLYCATECVDTIHANRDGTFWDPRPIIAKAFITNDLDTSQRATSVEIDLSNAPHLRVLPGIPLLKSKYDHAPKTTELFTWQLEPVAPIDVPSKETVIFYYRAGTDTVLRTCTCEIVLVPLNGIAYCAISAPDALTVSGHNYTPNSFNLDYTLTNTGNAQLDVAEISIQLPAYITTTDPVIQAVSPLAPSAQHDITWSLTALTSAYERESVITVVAKDAEGNVLSSCEHQVFLPGVDGLVCNAGEEIVLVYDLAANGYIPNPMNKSVTVHNGLDTALTNVEIEASVSSPDIAITMPVPPGNAISQIPAGQDWITNWTFQVSKLLDQQTTVTITYRIRSDQYPDWRECGFDVIIPPRQYTYCVDCIADGIDTVWINHTNEIMVPVPFQAYVAVANNCTGALTNVRCSIDVPSRLSLAPGETPVKSILRIEAGDTAYVSWDLAAAPAVADEAVNVQVSIAANELSAPSTCVHTVHLVHTSNIPLAVSKKLLYFQAVRNAALPQAQDITVYAGYPTEMPWTAQYPSWLNVQPDNSATTETQTVQPNTTAFPFGRYWGDIAYSSAQPNAPKTVNVVYDITDGTVGISQPPSTAHGITLHQNYPNPFASSTTISYTTEIAQPITVTVYNTLGVPVRVMHQQAEAGNNTIQLSGMAPGMYMVVVRGRDGIASRRMVGR